MKKIFCLLAACLLLILPVSAASLSEYRYDDAGLALSLPDSDGWTLLTHDAQEDDPAVEFFGIDYDTLKKALEQNSVRFDALTADRQQEITVIISRDSGTRRTFNYAILDEPDLRAQAQTYVDQDFSEQAPGLDYLSYDLVPSGDVLYIRFTGQNVNESTDSRFIQFATIYNGWMVNIALHSFDGEMSEENEVLITNIANSLRFDAALEKSQDAQRYIDIAVLAGVLTAAVLSLVWIYRSQKKKARLKEAADAARLDEEQRQRREEDDARQAAELSGIDGAYPGDIPEGGAADDDSEAQP